MTVDAVTIEKDELPAHTTGVEHSLYHLAGKNLVLGHMLKHVRKHSTRHMPGRH